MSAMGEKMHSIVASAILGAAVRRSAREDLLNLDLEQTYSQETKEALERELLALRRGETGC